MVTTPTGTYHSETSAIFPFLLLPRELRDRIYYHTIHLHHDTSANLLVLEGCDLVVCSPAEKPLLALACVNRQLKLEAQDTLHRQMSLRVLFARYKSSPPSGPETRQNILQSFEEIRKWRNVVLSPGTCWVNNSLGIAEAGQNYFSTILMMFFKFVVDNQQLLLKQKLHIHLKQLHRSSAPNCMDFSYWIEAQERLELFVHDLSAQFVENVLVHIDTDTIYEIAYMIHSRGYRATAKQTSWLIRIRDWCLDNRTIIQAVPHREQWWADKDFKKYAWLNAGRVKNKKTFKLRTKFSVVDDATCDNGDQCSLWI